MEYAEHAIVPVDTPLRQLPTAARRRRFQFSIREIMGWTFVAAIIVFFTRDNLLVCPLLLGWGIVAWALPPLVVERRRLLWYALIIAVGWLTFLIWCSLYVFVLYAIPVFILARRQYLGLVIFLATTPAVHSFGEGCLDYLYGNGRLTFRGTRLSFVDPEYRLVVGGGCGQSYPRDEQEAYRRHWRDSGLLFMVRTFGFLPGSYLGPYPNEDEVVRAFGNADLIKGWYEDSTYSTIHFETPKHSWSLDAFDLRRTDAYQLAFRRDNTVGLQIYSAIIEPRTLVVYDVLDSINSSPFATHHRAHLFDLATGFRFCTYHLELDPDKFPKNRRSARSSK